MSEERAEMPGMKERSPRRFSYKFKVLGDPVIHMGLMWAPSILEASLFRRETQETLTHDLEWVAVYISERPSEKAWNYRKHV